VAHPGTGVDKARTGFGKNAELASEKQVTYLTEVVLSLL